MFDALIKCRKRKRTLTDQDGIFGTNECMSKTYFAKGLII